MELKYKVLIVEDEARIGDFIANILHTAGYDVIRAENGKQALTMIRSHTPDLVILDLGLPDIDGLEILRQIRFWTMTPVIVVSARTHEHDKVEVLDAGADDYITKPFGSNELLARIRTALRHKQMMLQCPPSEAVTQVKTGDLIIDLEKRVVFERGREIHLTQNEFKIIAVLAKNIGKVMTYDSILKALWGTTVSDNNQAR